MRFQLDVPKTDWSGDSADFLEDLHVIKDDLFPIPPLFQMIQSGSDTAWREMYRVFNMGHRMEIYVPEQFAESIISISKQFKVDAKIIGHCEKASQKSVTIRTGNGEFKYG